MELEKENCNFDNVHIISNFYNYNNDGTINGYKGQIIHSFNKDETEVKLLPHYHKIADRKNVILLGDGLGDLEMAKGINYDNILKIGFYNKKEKENDFEQFQKGYDVLILNDGSMNYVLE
jgi:5'-nucleotidase